MGFHARALQRHCGGEGLPARAAVVVTAIASIDHVAVHTDDAIDESWLTLSLNLAF